MMWIMSVLFSVRNIWLLCQNEYVVSRETLTNNWVYASYLIADLAFWSQHWLYVSQYTRVSVMVPLTFC